MTTTVYRRDWAPFNAGGPAHDHLIECDEAPLEALARCLYERLASDVIDVLDRDLSIDDYRARWAHWLDGTSVVEWLADPTGPAQLDRLRFHIGSDPRVSLDYMGRTWVWLDESTWYGANLGDEGKEPSRPGTINIDGRSIRTEVFS